MQFSKTILSNTDPAPGSFAWRKTHQLMTMSDLTRRYLAVRHPRGDYRVPMVDDYLPCWRPQVEGET